jgi:hypothetical protein
MDTGKLRLDEIVGPAEAFFSVRNFASLRKGIFLARFSMPWKEKKSVLFNTIYLFFNLKKFIALKKQLYWKIICIENHLSLKKKILAFKNFFHRKNMYIEKLLTLKKLLSLKNCFTYKMLHLNFF